MMMLPRSVRIGSSIASSVRLASLLLIVLALFFAAVASAQTAHYSGAQYTIYGPSRATYGVAADSSGNVFFTDSSGVHEIVAVNGVASSTSTVRLLGNGSFIGPMGVAVDGSGNVFVADELGNSVYEILASNDTVEFLGSFTYPTGVAVDGSGDVFVAAQSGVYEMVAVDGVVSSTGTVNPLASGNFSGPLGIAADASGDVFVADTGNSAVKEILAASGYTMVRTLGSGFYRPYAVTVDGSGNVFVADTWNNAVKEMLASEGSIPATPTINTLGSGFNQPDGVAVVSSGDVFVADQGNSRVIKLSSAMLGANFGSVDVVSPSSVITFLFTFDSAGTIQAPAVLTMGTPGLDYADASTGSCTSNGPSHVYSTGDICTVDVIFTPAYPGTQMGAVELLASNSNILTTAYSTGIGLGPLAGFSPGTVSVLNVTGLPLNKPRRPVFDAQGNLYEADNGSCRIIKIAPTGAASALVNIGSGNAPTAVTMDGAGNLYFAVNDNSVRKYTPAGVLTTLDNNGLSYYNVTVAVDGSGNVYTNDAGSDYSSNARIIWFPKGGAAQVFPFNGYTFENPWAVAVDGVGDLYVSDHTSNALVKITNGIANVVNTGSVTFNEPLSLTLDSAGNIYVVDYNNNRVVEIPSGSTDPAVVLSMGSLSPGLDTPVGDAVSRTGELYIMDTGNNRIVVSSQESAPQLNFGSINVGSYSSAQTVTLMNLGNGPLSFAIPESGTNPSMSSNFLLNSSTCPTVNSTDETSATLAANSSCAYQIDFAPRQTGYINSAFTLTDNASNGAVQSLALSGTGTGTAPTIVVSPTTATLTGGTIGGYTPLTFTASGGTSPYSYAPMIPGSLPAGLTLSSDGTLSGTPSAVGTFFFTVIASDTNSYTGSQAYSLMISQATQTISFLAPSAPVTYGVAPISLSATGGASGNAVTFSVVSGPGAVSGSTLTITGVGTVVVAANQAGNSNYAAAAQVTQSITVNAATLPIGSPNPMPMSVIFTIPSGLPGTGTLAAPLVFTQGATGLDFTNATTGSCTSGTAYSSGITCTVNVTFTPKYAGMRYGAVVLEDSAGTVLATQYISGSGTGPQVNFLPGTQSTVTTSTSLDWPFGVAVDASGNVYIADSANNRVLKETLSAGSYSESTIGSGLGAPNGVAVDGAGNVYIADTGNSQILMVPWTGSGYGNTIVVANFAVNNLRSPDGVAVDGSGNVYIADSGNDRVMMAPWVPTGYGALVTVADQLHNGLNQPAGVAVDGIGNVYIADTKNSQVLMLPWTGTGYGVQRTVATAANGLSNPYGIAVDGASNVYIADTMSWRVVKETLSGGNYIQSTIGSGSVNPEGVAVDGSGNVYLTNSGIGQVVKMDFADAPTLNFPTSTVAGTTDSADGSMVVTVENIGSAPITFSALIYPSDFPEVVGSNDCSTGTQLAAGTSCPLTISFSPTVAGSLNEMVALADNSLYGASAQSVTVSGVALEGAQTITFSSPGNQTFGVAPITLTGSASSLLPVSYSVISGPATVNLATLTITGAGLVSIQATQSGNGSFAPAIPVSVTFTVNKATSTITTLPTASTITYGQTLASSSLTGGAGSTSGNFAFVSPTTVPGAGTATQGVIFTPTDTTDYTPVTGSINVAVNKATPTIGWPAPANISYGTALSTTQLNAAAVGSILGVVAGTYVYTPAAGSIPATGTDTLSVTFIPADGTDYTMATQTVSLTVTQATAIVTLGSLTQTYNGAPEPVTVSTSPAGLGLAYSYTGISGTPYGPSMTAPTNPGSYSVVATVLDLNYIGQDSETLTINQLNPALNFTLMSGAPATTPYGTTVYFELGMASAIRCPSGSVQFYVDGNVSGSPVVLSGAGSCIQPVQLQTATLPPGPHNAYATYSGDTYYAGGTSGTLPYTVTQDTTSVTLATSGTSANVGQPLTFTATVTPGSLNPGALPPAGYVQFVDGVNQIGSNVPLSGNTAAYTISTLAFGTHNIFATFVDTDGNFVGNSSVVAVETVNLIVPTINFAPTPAEFVYGTPLNANTQLNATAADPTSSLTVPGSFSYNFAANAVVPAGTPNLIATFTPADPTTYAVNSATVSITVDTAVLTVTPDNFSITYGAAIPTLTYQIAGYQSSDPSTVVSGTASCTTSATVISIVATYPITCSTGSLAAANYSFRFVSGTLNVTQTTPAITTLPTASAIAYGQTLSSSTLTGGAGSVAGSFAFTSPATAPGAGTTNQGVTFTPADAVDYNTATGSVSVTVNKAASAIIEWPTAASSITYGQTLASSTLSGGVNTTPGTFAFTTPATAPGAGTASQSVTFTPTDLIDYNSAAGSVNVMVNKATPVLSWAIPAAIPYGMALSSMQLNATSGGVAGTLAYTPAAGSIPAAGTHTLSVTFTPTDTTDYATVTQTVSLTVGKVVTTTTVQSSALAAMTQSNVSLTANVYSSAGTPAGSVSFMDGSTSLGTGTLDNSGAATLTLNTLSVGSHNITAVYAGNVDFVGSTSSAITETVEDFNFSVSGTTTVLAVTVLPGNSAVYTLQLSPTIGSTFAGAVVLTLTGLPAGATCTITPSTILAGSGAATITVTVNTAKTSASLNSSSGSNAFPIQLLPAILLPAFGMRKLRRAARLRMMPSRLILSTLALLMAMGMAACGGSSLPPPQTIPMTLTATSGAVHHSVTLDLTVQ